MVSTPQLTCPENQELRKEHIRVMDTVEPIEQCPILNDYVQARLELSFLLKNYVSLAWVLHFRLILLVISSVGR